MDGTAVGRVGVYVGNVVGNDVVIILAFLLLIVSVTIGLFHNGLHFGRLATVAKGGESPELPFQHGVVALILFDNTYKPILINETFDTIILFCHNLTLFPGDL